MYLKEVGDFAGYYREALRYLGVEDIGKMSAEEKHVQVGTEIFVHKLLRSINRNDLGCTNRIRCLTW